MTKKQRRGRDEGVPLSDQLRSVIRRRGLVPYSVAKASGVAPSVVTRFLSGETSLSGPNMDKIASALNLSLAELRGGLRN